MRSELLSKRYDMPLTTPSVGRDDDSDVVHPLERHVSISKVSCRSAVIYKVSPGQEPDFRFGRRMVCRGSSLVKPTAQTSRRTGGRASIVLISGSSNIT